MTPKYISLDKLEKKDKHRIGTVIKDHKDNKWQLIKVKRKAIWVPYKIHSNIKTKKLV